jgi:hypothetical protein
MMELQVLFHGVKKLARWLKNNLVCDLDLYLIRARFGGLVSLLIRMTIFTE